MSENQIKTAPKSPKVNAGGKFNRWTVLSFSHKIKKNRWWICRCDCGTQKKVVETTLRYGRAKSCGCLQKELNRARITHGHSRKDDGGTREYHCWANMIQRCSNPRLRSYRDYGGRGIKVCDAWKQFDGFYASMGSAPTRKHSLDRWPDKNGNYEPGNCRWATIQQQAENKRNNVLLTYKGETLVMGVMAKKHGLTRDCVKGRLNRGWSVEKTLETPWKKSTRTKHDVAAPRLG